MADVPDLSAVQTADGFTDKRTIQAEGTSRVAGFYPSLHLTVGECYEKLGDVDRAREHLELGLETIGFRADDRYGATIK